MRFFTKNIEKIVDRLLRIVFISLRIDVLLYCTEEHHRRQFQKGKRKEGWNPNSTFNPELQRCCKTIDKYKFENQSGYKRKVV